MKVIIVDNIPKILSEILQMHNFECLIQQDISEKNLIKEIAKFEGIIIKDRVTISKGTIDKAKKLKFIAKIGSDSSKIDVDYTVKKGILYFQPDSGNSEAVGEHALAMLLGLFNNLCRANMQVKNGIWKSESNQGILLQGKTIGLIGYGKTGNSFAKKLSGFNINLLAYDKYKTGYGDSFAKESGMKDIFKYSDILSLHIPLTKETHNLVDFQFLNKFEKKIYLINTSHGRIVSTHDIAKGIQNGKVLGAALDVLEYENSIYEKLHFENMPDSLQFLIDSDNVMLSPHIAGNTKETEIKMAENLAHKIINAFEK